MDLVMKKGKRAIVEKKIKKMQLSTVYLVREKIGSFAYNKKTKEWRKY